MSWQNYSGKQLKELYQSAESGLVGAIPNKPGIYMWKLRASTPEMERESRWTQFVDLLDERCNTKLGEHLPNQGHWISYGPVEIRGNKLTEHKKNTLNRLKRTAQQTYTREFLQHLNAHTPALYVGEAKDLLLRINQHLNEETDFATRMKEGGLSFDKLHLWWWELDQQFEKIFEEVDDQSIRQTLEYITNMVSIGAYTKRPG